MQPLSHSMPIGEVSREGIIVNKAGAVSIGMAFQHPTGPFPIEDYEAGNETFVKAMSPFPDGTIFNFQEYYHYMEWQPLQNKGAQSFLSAASNTHFSGRPYLENQSYLFITMPAPERKPATWGGSALLRRNLLPTGLLDEGRIRRLLEAVDQFEATLNGSKRFQVRRLSKEEILGADGQPGLLERYMHLLPPGQPPVLGDITFDKEGIRVTDKPCLIYTLADAEQLPEQCSTWTRYLEYSTPTTTMPTGFSSWLGPHLPVEHCLNTYIVLLDRNKLAADLEKRQRRLNSAAGHSRENIIARDDIEKYLHELAEGNRPPVRAHITLLSWAPSPDRLPAINQQICAAINRMGAIPRLETIGAPLLWYAGFPGNADQLPVSETFLGFLDQAACFVIREATSRDSASSQGVRLCDRYSGRPLQVDLSEEPKRRQWINNLNKLVIAGSGGGKSYLMLLMVRSYFDQGAHTVIVDIGGSYRRLCALLNGQYFAYTEEAPIRFNPFRLEKDEMPDTEKKESLKSLLHALWKRNSEAFRQSEYVALSNAIHGYFLWLPGRNDILPAFNSFYEYVRDVYSAELAATNVRREEFDIDNFLYVLRPYYRGGEYDYLLNAEDQPSLLQERLIVFDIDAIKDHPILFPVVTIVIMEVFISKMRRLHGVRKVIVIEEAWKAIAKEGMDEYIRYLFKTVRKFYGEAIVVTQEIEDIVSSAVVKNAIINNADTRIILDIRSMIHRIDPIKQLLGLTDFALAQVLSVNKVLEPTRKYKEAAISFANGPCRVYGVETSLEEYLTFTTEETERVVVNQYIKEEGDSEKGIRKLANAIRAGAVKLFLVFVLIFLQKPASAQVLEVVDLINTAVKKVIEAADLEVQRLQTQTIALQDAEKALENSMAGDLLGDITNWVQQQEDLYGAYYQELWMVKSALSGYSKTVTLIDRQVQVVREEQQDWAAVQQDPHFTVAELNHIATVYNGILTQSIRNVQQIKLVIESSITQMDDAGRLGIIDETSRNIDANFQDLRQFTQSNSLLSLQRAKDENDLLMIKTLYNLP